MNTTFKLQQPLTSIFWPRPTTRLVHNLAIILLGSGLITLAAKINVPLQPVPVTLQNLAVLLIGMTLGGRLGMLVVAAYLLEGIMGLPVFAFGNMVGPRAGYLGGFLVAAGLVGYLVENGWGKQWLTVMLAAVLGNSLIYLCGYTVLALYIGWQPAWELGVLPFLAVDFVKVILLAIMVPFCWQVKLKTRA